MVKDFLPISKKDMKKRGWEQCDFVYVIGDAYVDHPSFGPAIISRLLEAHGYKVGIIAQPDWKDQKQYRRCLVHRGWDFWYLREIWIPWSTIIRYPKSAVKQDSYTPGGVMGKTTGLCDGGVLQPDPSDL